MLSGVQCLVTGANAGIGFHTARVLAQRGASVWLACRSSARAAAAMEAIRRVAPSADLRFVPLDLADLASIADAARHVLDAGPIDLLFNNAGVMTKGESPPTRDGFETQVGVNHLGHFALSAHLLPHLRDRVGARIVTVASLAANGGEIDFEGLRATHGDSAFRRYRMSKLANLLFAFELSRRLERGGCAARSLACHPGAAATEILRAWPRPLVALALPAMRVLLNSAAAGALPSLYAATNPSLMGGEYVGPSGFLGLRGRVQVTRAGENAYDAEDAARLWQHSIELTGVDPGI